jgi:hypothetical protein
MGRIDSLFPNRDRRSDRDGMEEEHTACQTARGRGEVAGDVWNGLRRNELPLCAG